MGKHISLPIVFLLFTSQACSVTGDGTPMGGADASADDPYAGDKIAYREMSTHPGCSVDALTYSPASMSGYPCAAKAYAFPEGVSEDTTKPIVLLIHGNSDSPVAWERFPADTGDDQLAELLPAAGFRTYAIDMRIDLVDDPQGDNETQNAARNIDHGWSTPLVEGFIGATMTMYPGRRITIIGFSLGVTVARDALRRMHAAGDEPFAVVEDLIYLAGANHGVSSFPLCAVNPTMRGRVTCEMGSRDNFTPTEFLMPLNGPDGAYETPCADGSTAFGETGVCGGNTVEYTTIVMRDLPDGTYQDLFVSAASARLEGATNHQLELTDVDDSGYFFDGLFKNHYGAARSAAALQIIMSVVE